MILQDFGLVYTYRVRLFGDQVSLAQIEIVSGLENCKGSSGIWTRDLSHPKRESYP